MPYSEWRPGIIPPSPVYLDACTLTASFIARDPRYKNTTRLFADLLGSRAELLISMLTLSESLWGIAKLSFQQIERQKARTHFAPHIFRKHADNIFRVYGARMHAIHSWLRDWRQSGINVSLMPNDVDSLQQVSQVAPTYMQKFRLASSDAYHLATAEMGAKSLLTTDTEFERADASPLEIYLIAA